MQPFRWNASGKTLPLNKHSCSFHFLKNFLALQPIQGVAVKIFLKRIEIFAELYLGK